MNAVASLRVAPVVSIQMPVRNGARFLAEALESLRTQEMTEFEVIVVDDGSTDMSVAIAQEVSRRDSRFRIVSNNGTGLGNARNTAVALARGEFIANLDADDVAKRTRLIRQVTYLKEHPECVAIGSNAELISEAGVQIRPSDVPTSHEEIEQRFLEGRAGILNPTAMMRTDAVRKLGGYRNQFSFAEDLDLFLRLAEIGRLANLPDQLIQYRVHADSVSRGQSPIQRQRAIAALAEAYSRRGRSLPDDVRRRLLDIRSPSEWHIRFARQAMKAGDRRQARRHAWKAARRAPFRLATWKTLLRSLLG